MKKLILFFLISSSFLFCTVPAQSKEAKYKGLFNLATDARYYSYVQFKASHKFKKILLLNVVDKRQEQEKIFNEKTQYFSDDVWAEPPVKMLGKIFLKELRWTDIFESVDFDEPKPSLILQIELTSFIGHYDDRGRVARGVVKIHTILKSALDNRIIEEKNYEGTKSCLVGRFQNAYRYMYRNIGDALNLVVSDMVRDIENTLKKELGK